jgi:hypothetical protein
MFDVLNQRLRIRFSILYIRPLFNMDIVGTVAAGITFGALILKLSRSLYKSAKKIRYASREIMKLVKEMGIFADLYEDFYRVCVSDQRKKGRNTSSTRRLIDWMH